MEIKIGNHVLGESHPTYFVPILLQSTDGSLDRARHLIHSAARARADAAKFQNFQAP